MYLHAEWEAQFDPFLTADAPFIIDQDRFVVVPMMRKIAWFPYCQRHGFHVVELPYRGGELSLVVLVPEAAPLEEAEAGLDVGRLEELLAALVPREIRLALPRLRFSAKAELSNVLAALGMPDAFSPDTADFSPMVDGPVLISAVIHEATLDVDEQGTTADAATAVVMKMLGDSPPPVPVRIDRPFLFVLRDRPTGTILFLGRVINPTANGNASRAAMSSPPAHRFGSRNPPQRAGRRPRRHR